MTQKKKQNGILKTTRYSVTAIDDIENKRTPKHFRCISKQAESPFPRKSQEIRANLKARLKKFIYKTIISTNHSLVTFQNRKSRSHSCRQQRMYFRLFLIIASLVAPTWTTSSSEQSISKCDKSPLTELTFQLSGNSLLWPCESTKNIYVQSGRYVPRNVIVTRAQLQRDSAFVALPRYKQGVPFTLGKVNLKKGQCLTKIAPYPCWAIQEEGNCQALQSVVDIAVDQNVSWSWKILHFDLS